MTYLRADVMEVYRGMGMDGPQLAMIKQLGFAQPGYMVAMTIAAWIPFLILLTWAKIALRAAKTTRNDPTSPNGR